MLIWQCESTGSSLTGNGESKLKVVPEDGEVPELSDYYPPSEAQKQYELAYIVGDLALAGWAAFRFL